MYIIVSEEDRSWVYRQCKRILSKIMWLFKHLLFPPSPRLCLAVCSWLWWEEATKPKIIYKSDYIDKQSFFKMRKCKNSKLYCCMGSNRRTLWRRPSEEYSNGKSMLILLRTCRTQKWMFGRYDLCLILALCVLYHTSNVPPIFFLFFFYFQSAPRR